MKKAVIVVPTYNEAGNIKRLIPQIFNAVKSLENWQVEVLIVDSRSSDNSLAIIKELQKEFPRLHLLETPKEGLGRAYYKGFNYAINQLQPYVIGEMDADLSHPAKTIPQLLAAIEKGADFAIGSRYIKGGSIPEDWGWHRKVFSTLGNLVVRFGFMKLKIADWTGGFRMIKIWIVKQALDYIKNYSGYVFQIALLDFAVKNKARFQEIPYHFAERTEGVSKINSVQYISQILLYIFFHSSFVKFVIVGLIGFVVDFSVSYLFINNIKSAVWLATLISTETAILCNFILNNFWSFSHKKIESGLIGYIFNFLKFNFVSAGSILIQTIGVTLAANFFGQSYWYLYKIIIIAFIIIPYSYVLYNKVVWKEK
jgi:dolichol-phosphate mannosyltransferase